MEAIDRCGGLGSDRFAALAVEDEDVTGPEGAGAGAVVDDEVREHARLTFFFIADLRHDLEALEAMVWSTDASGGRSFAYGLMMASRASLVTQLAELGVDGGR